MREISSSLYPSPSPSLMSRDPDGLDPDELDKAPRLEPAGFRSETVAAVNAIKAVKAARRQRKLESLKNMDVAKLVGVPPPPPKTPPPKKAHRQTPKAASSPSEGAKFQFTDTKEISDESLVETAQVDEVKSDFPMRAAGVGDIIPPPPPPPPAAPRDVQKTRVSAEQRRQATLAKYQHEDAVLDREETLLAEELLRPAITKKSEEDQKVVESRLAMAFSPSSEVTKHHSNQRNEMLSRPVQHGISSAANYSSPSADEEKEVEKKQESRKRGFSLERKNKSENKSEKSKEAKQKRGFFQKLFRGKGKEGGSSQERSSTNKSKQVDPPVVQEPKGQESSIDSELISVPQKSKNESDALSNDSVPSVQQPALKPVLKGVSERQYQGDPDPLLTDMVMPTTDSTLGTAQVEDENLLISSKLSNDGSLKAPKSFSQDPPDDEHGDPPVYSGRPLVSPRSIHPHLSVTVSEDEEEQSRIESVRSRIADVYGEHLHAVHHNQDEHAPITGVPSSLSDKPDYFFHNDEVSALTGICPSKSFDPSPFTEGSIDSDPQGDYNIPRPSTKAQDGGPSLLPGSNMIDPYSASPSNKTDNGPLPTPAHLSHLRVQVPARSMDPAGDSPFYAGTGGRQASHTFGDPVGESPIAWNKTNLSTNDPVGESPCHAAGRPDGIEEGEFADPELTAGYLSEDSSCSGAEEKKEEEEQVEEKPSDAAKVQESTTESSSGNIVTPAIPEAPKDNDAMSNISQAALKIVKSSGTDAIIAQLNALPSPAHKGSSNDRVGSTPVSSDAKNLQVDTDMKMSGFRSGSNTPASTKKALTVTAAAFTNAKAVAYLHRLQGEPSPRHSWRVSKKKQGEQSPVSHAPVESKGKKKKGKKKGKVIAAQKKAPSPDEYGAHNLPQMQPSDEEDENQGPREDVTPKASHVGQRKPPSPEVLMSKLPEKPLSVYNSRIGCHSKFQGRKPKKDAPIPEVALKKPKTVPEKPVQPVIRVGKITKIAVTKGLQMRRNKRKDDIESGRATPVVVTPRQKPAGRNRFNFVPTKESEIKDPIQRAGRRLLSKAAVPIQTVARRYIAKREAVNRMWALIVIQSAFRRWRCEVNLQASLHSAKVVQTAFRGWFIREKVKDMHFSATQIQKIVRGHLAAAHVYDTIYYVVRIQALLRGCYSRKCDVKKREAAAMIQKYCRGHLTRFNLIGASKVLPIQALYRGHKARREMKASFTAVSLIQSTWRSYSARMSFQFQIVDVIIVQSIARRWAACRRTKILKHMEHGPAGHSAAQKIQASWRGYQCYTDYIFALVDILVAQRTVRQWLAVKKANALRQETKQEKAAIQLQKQWRRHKAQLTLLYSMVHIIIVQSVARRFLSRFAVQARKREIRTGRTEEQRRYDASTSIQKTWRGFWGFSHFIIVRYEITRLQALIRGKLARQSYNLKLGCAIIIQASARQYLAKKAVDSKITSNAVVASAAQELRERIASKRIQFWWRIVHEWIKEKKAALTIERFFIHVREEVDLEVIRCERKKITKQQQRRKKRRESEEQMLERVWLKTVDEDRGGSRSQSAPRIRGANSTLSAADNNMQYRMPALGMHPHRMPSPRANQGKREAGYQGWPLQCLDSTSVGMQVPTDAIHVAPSADVSEVSNITNPSVFHRMGHGYPNSRHMMKPPRTERTERIDEISLGETSQGFEARQSSRMTTEDYIKKYGGGGGLKTAPNRLSSSSGQTPQHFFSDDGGAAQRNLHIVPSNGTPTAYQSQTQVMTPRSHQGSSRRKSSSGTPRKSSSGTPRSSRNSIGASSPGLPVTPRSHVSHHPQSPRVPTGNNHRGERHLSYPPPATPTRQKTLNGRGDKFHGISRLETAETQSQTTMSHTTYSKQSPRSRPEGHRVHGGPVPVMVMKTYPNFSQSLSIDEAQEVLYLGEEYGEV